jgi:hypothetical protein
LWPFLCGSFGGSFILCFLFCLGGDYRLNGGESAGISNRRLKEDRQILRSSRERARVIKTALAAAVVVGVLWAAAVDDLVKHLHASLEIVQPLTL